MRTHIFTAAVLAFASVYCFNTADADIIALNQTDSLVAFSSGGTVTSDGTVAGNTGNTLGIFDGDAFASTPDEGFFATSVFSRSRSNTTQTSNIAGAFVDFDLSAFQSVTSATLEFTAYSLNNNGPLTVGQVTEAPNAAGRSYDPDRTNVLSANFDFATSLSSNPDAQAVNNFSFDFTAAAQAWVADPTTNLGLYFQVDNTTNDGFGILDGSTTQINDGSVDDAFTGVAIPANYIPLTLTVDGDLAAVPEPSSALLLAIGGIAFGINRRRK